MSKKHVIVIGGNFAGMSAALELMHLLSNDVAVTVISKSDKFLFVPSLIWVPFGKRKPKDITFDVAPTLDAHGVEFVLDEATQVDAAAQQVYTAKGQYAYDYLIIASGFNPQFNVISGMEPGKHSYYCIASLEQCLQALEGWRRFVDDPGPVVIGVTQEAGCMGAAYEFLFNFAYELKKKGLRAKAPITFVTPEPFAGHFGIGGLRGGEKMLGFFFKKLGVNFIGGAAMQEVVPGEVHLADGRALPYKYAMIMPPFLGADMVRRSNGLGDTKGLIPVKPNYQHASLPNIYAAGASVAVNPPWQTPIAVGVPKTGFPAEVMARVASHNIAAQIQGKPPAMEKAFGDIPAICVMDAGNLGVMIFSDKMLPPRKHELLIPGPQAHWAKLAFEKYFIWKMKNGYVSMP
jgi:sulfide:quinone oxidoreductase